MSSMNYRNIAVREIKEFSEQFPKYTLGEIFYSILRQAVEDPATIKSFRSLTDEQIYTMVDKAREIESDQ